MEKMEGISDSKMGFFSSNVESLYCQSSNDFADRFAL